MSATTRIKPATPAPGMGRDELWWTQECTYLTKVADRNGMVSEMLFLLPTFIRYCEMQQRTAMLDKRHDTAEFIGHILNDMRTMQERHTLSRIQEGRDAQALLTPTCSCGWQGLGYSKVNPWQLMNVRDQETDHIRTAKQKPAP